MLARWTQNVCCCVTPSSDIVVLTADRLGNLTAAEVMGFQGFELDKMHISLAASELTHRDFIELAGSSFHIGSAGAALLAAMVVRGPHTVDVHAL